MTESLLKGSSSRVRKWSVLGDTSPRKMLRNSCSGGWRNDSSEAVVGDGVTGEWLEKASKKSSLFGDDIEVLGVLGGEKVVWIGYEMIAAGFRRLKGLNLLRKRREGVCKVFVDHNVDQPVKRE